MESSVAEPAPHVERSEEEAEVEEEQDESWQTSVPKRIHKQRLAMKREEEYASRYEQRFKDHSDGNSSRSHRSFADRRRVIENVERKESREEHLYEHASTDSNEDDKPADQKTKIFDKEKFVEAPPPKTNPWAKKASQDTPPSSSPPEGAFHKMIISSTVISGFLISFVIFFSEAEETQPAPKVIVASQPKKAYAKVTTAAR